MDIITANIGGPSGWSNNPWAEVASRIAREGVVVTISAGNWGSAGPFFSRCHDVSVHNDGKESVSYTFSAQPGAGVEAAGWFPRSAGGGEYRIRSLAELKPTEFEP